MTGALARIISAWKLVARRSLAHWRLLSSVVLGVLLASAIMAGTVIYFEALRDLALKNSLAKHTDNELDIVVRGKRSPTSRDEYEKVAAVAIGEIDARVSWMGGGLIHVGKTPTLFLTKPGDEGEAGRFNARAYIAFLPRLSEHTTLLPGGRMPRDERLSAPGEPLEMEALIQRDTAQLFGVGVGDRLSAVPYWTDITPHVSIVISGIFDKNDFDDQIWYLEERVLDSLTGKNFRTAAFFVSETAFLDVLGPAFSKLDSTYAWLLDVDPKRLNGRNAEAAMADIRAMRSTLSSTLSSYQQETALVQALREYDRKLFFSKLPMFVVLILIAFVVLYYVVTISSLAVEQRRAEVALLRSRGATSAQILLVFVLEGATIAVLAVVVGPLLAAAATSALGLTPAFSDLTGGERLAVNVSGGAYAMGAVGGVLSFVALMVPAVQASRIGVTRHRQQAARPGAVPAFQRYYLDVLLLLVSIYLFRQLSQQGSVVATQLFGAPTVSQLLLALPGLMLVGAAMVLLRLFPLAMNLGSRLFSAWLPAGVVMGVWQMARSPTHYARLSLLLILTAGLGIFASSFGATLERSFQERVLYATGSDVRVDGVRPADRARWDYTQGYSLARRVRTRQSNLASAYEKVPGVELASPVLRAEGRDLTGEAGISYEMLAIDADSFGKVAWFRDDFGDRPVDRLLEGLKDADPPRGIAMPEDAFLIGARVKADRPNPSVKVTARLRNAQGQYSTYRLGILATDKWTDMVVSLKFGTRQSLQLSRPLTLISLRVEETGARRLQAGSILIDEIWAIEAWGTTVLEDFDDTSGWSVLRVTRDAVSDVLRESDVSYDEGSGTVLFTWSEGSPGAARGIFPGPPAASVPVLASTAFAEETGRANGEVFDVSVDGLRLPVRLTGTVDLFPTMTVPDKRYLVADLTALMVHANLGASFREPTPNEMWISSSTAGQERAELIQSLAKVRNLTSEIVFDRSVRLAESKVDPLVDAGWSALLFIAFSAVLILSCLGVLVHAYVSLRNRQLQFALLRTVGLSMRQLMTMVWLEQMLVIAVGLALGTWMGGRLGAIIMPFLGHDDWGGVVMPPFAMQVNWGTLLVTYGVMVAVFAAITGGLVWLIRRLSLHLSLRMGEM